MLLFLHRCASFVANNSIELLSSDLLAALRFIHFSGFFIRMYVKREDKIKRSVIFCLLSIWSKTAETPAGQRRAEIHSAVQPS
ncbi:hypothetical protein AC739_03095 [Planococcus glaciei]|nr:hypothetical protein AC739_03095 [Planococcus glaciei]